LIIQTKLFSDLYLAKFLDTPVLNKFLNTLAKPLVKIKQNVNIY